MSKDAREAWLTSRVGARQVSPLGGSTVHAVNPGVHDSHPALSLFPGFLELRLNPSSGRPSKGVCFLSVNGMGVRKFADAFCCFFLDANVAF